uniref:Putative group ix salivary lipocalin n=1 Tax=Rhipicephalus pulchellus TaxID=72859 RepID=L7M9T2_RHIPC
MSKIFQRTTKMNTILRSSLLLIAHWAFCEGQMDYSKMDPEKLLYINYTNELLNGSMQLFLKWGFGGPLNNNACICWTSNKSSDPVVPTFRRNLAFYNKTAPGNCRWESRDTYWATGATNYTPVVGVESFVQGHKDPETTGIYTLFFATPTCFIMGLLRGTPSTKSNSTESLSVDTDNSTCMLWARRHPNGTEDRDECELKFNSSCSMPVTMYRRGHGNCNFTVTTTG